MKKLKAIATHPDKALAAGPALLRPPARPRLSPGRRRMVLKAGNGNGKAHAGPNGTATSSNIVEAPPRSPKLLAGPSPTDAPVAFGFADALAPEQVELKLLLEAVFLQSGFDFRNYRRPLIQQRVEATVQREGLRSISELQAVVLREPLALERLVVDLSERRTHLFGDPAFYWAFRQEVVPLLRTYPFARIWVVGCGDGGEAYSLAMVLLEEGLLGRCRIYATDLCEPVLLQAKAGLWPLAACKRAAASYRRTGGKLLFAQHYTVEDGQARLSAALTKNIVFAAHNFMTDASFNEFHVIVCRTLLQDFDLILQSQVHELLYGSLVPRGVLALGGQEELNLTLHQTDYEPLPHHGLYRKKWPSGSA